MSSDEVSIYQGRWYPWREFYDLCPSLVCGIMTMSFIARMTRRSGRVYFVHVRTGGHICSYFYRNQRAGHFYEHDRRRGVDRMSAPKLAPWGEWKRKERKTWSSTWMAHETCAVFILIFVAKRHNFERTECRRNCLIKQFYFWIGGM